MNDNLLNVLEEYVKNCKIPDDVVVIDSGINKIHFAIVDFDELTKSKSKEMQLI